MAATNRYMNVSAMTYTPAGGIATPITGVTSVTYAENGQELNAAADFDLFDTIGAIVGMAPTVTVETINALLGFPSHVAGGTGTLVFTVRDVYNAATTAGGAKIFTISNCFFKSRTVTAAFRSLATQSLGFGMLSSDGATNPTSIAAA